MASVLQAQMCEDDESISQYNTNTDFNIIPDLPGLYMCICGITLNIYYTHMYIQWNMVV